MGADSLDGLDDIHATGDRAEHDVLAIEPEKDRISSAMTSEWRGRIIGN